MGRGSARELNTLADHLTGHRNASASAISQDERQKSDEEDRAGSWALIG